MPRQGPLLRDEKPFGRIPTKPIDPAAKEALEDFDYQKGMEKYGEKVIETMEPVWQKEYLGKSNE